MKAEEQKSPDEAIPQRKKDRRFGKLDDQKEELKNRIIDGDNDASYVHERSKGLDYQSIAEIIDVAINTANIGALLGLAKTNKKVVAQLMKTNAEKIKRMVADSSLMDDSRLAQLYFVIRREIDGELRRLFQRLATKAIIKSALRVAGRGIHGNMIIKVPYKPGMDEFDLEQTLENYMERGYLDHETIIGVERVERRRAGLLILDASGSMYGEKILTAAMTIAVLAYNLRYDDYGIIAFNDEPHLIKGVRDNRDIEEIIRALFELGPSGYTNIAGALNKGFSELTKIKTRDKWGVLVTDGDYNMGGDPLEQAGKYPKLHVIKIPSKSKRGRETCRDIAKRGKGAYAAVERYEDIPRTLMKVIR